jgi:hypothetical protein
MDGEKQQQKQYDWLKAHQWKPGQSGNPNGRPPGKSLKTFVREYFEQLGDDEKMEFLKHVDPKTAWEMAEGKPETKTDVTSNGQTLQVIVPGPVAQAFNVNTNPTTNGEASGVHTQQEPV